MPEAVKEKKKYDDWINFRSEPIKRRLKAWAKKNRRPNISDAARIIIEDRLEKDGIK